MEMWYVSKRMEIAAGHHLSGLPYGSKCERSHGHNYIVIVHCKASKLTEYGMVVDFAKAKEAIHDRLDHSYLNDIGPFVKINPTAENMAKWICDEVTKICEVGFCYKVEVQESEGNIAIYERDEDQ